MRRRDLLAVAGTAALAGCTAGQDADAGDASDPSDEVATLSLAEQGVPPTVCEESLDPDGIRAIADPVFGAPAAFPDAPDRYRPLVDERTVVGLTHDGAARAYPLTVLNVHEVVNDAFGAPVIVTYCPICRSGMVAERRVAGTRTLFDVSGLLWQPPRVYSAASEEDGRVFSDREEGIANNGNLVLYDAATGSYWSQLLATAICGDRRGERMTIRPASVTTWGRWRREHPETTVLLPPPVSTTVDPPI